MKETLRLRAVSCHR